MSATPSPYPNTQSTFQSPCRDLPCLDEGLALLGPHAALTSLSLQGCSTLTDRGLEALSQMPSLVTINVGDCGGITGLGCAAWEPLRDSLSALQLQNSPGVSDAGLAAISLALGGAQGALRELNLKHCRKVTDVGLAALAAELRRLTSLTLQVGDELGIAPKETLHRTYPCGSRPLPSRCRAVQSCAATALAGTSLRFKPGRISLAILAQLEGRQGTSRKP